MIPPLSDLLALATTAALDAGRIALDYFGSSRLQVDTKQDRSPVTEADRRAEERIASIIRERYPEHGLLGEEFGEQVGSERVRWIIDPIDGTKSFICGVPLWGVMIAVEIDETIAAGVVNMPALGEVYSASAGGGSYRNGERIHVSTVESMGQSVLTVSDVRHFHANDSLRSIYTALEGATRWQRTWGDCYGYMLLASGRTEIAMDVKMSPWDCAAVKIIVEEAGGRFTAWDGRSTIHGGNAVASNGRLHQSTLDLLSGKAHHE